MLGVNGGAFSMATGKRRLRATAPTTNSGQCFHNVAAVYDRQKTIKRRACDRVAVHIMSLKRSWVWKATGKGDTETMPTTDG